MQLESYVAGRWRSGSGQGVALRDATTGEVIANATADGLDHAALLAFAREVGGRNLRRLTFHERAAMLKALAKHLGERKEEFYSLSYATGATKSDSWIDIDGGHRHALRVREQGHARAAERAGLRRRRPGSALQDGHLRRPAHLRAARGGGGAHQRVQLPRLGHAREARAGACSPACRRSSSPPPRPRTSPSAVFRAIIESGILPEGAVQLICGSVGDLLRTSRPVRTSCPSPARRPRR